MLTGKNKEQFEKFYADEFQQGNFYKLGWFYGLPLSMQFGVVVDYADSIGYDVNAFKSLNDDMNGYVYVSSVNDNCVDDTHKTRDKARLAAIKAFDEIVNRDTRKVKHKK